MKNDNPEIIIKRLIDMETRRVLGNFPWQFIFDLEELDPEKVNSELIILTHSLLAKIPAEWHREHDELLKCLGFKKDVYLGVSHIYQEGKAYTISGRLRGSGGLLGFHKITFYDDQLIFDHYITSVITDKNGEFKFSFDSSFLHHHHRFKRKMHMPYLVLKIFEWENRAFNLFEGELKFKPESLNIEIQNKKRMIIDLGDIDISDLLRER